MDPGLHLRPLALSGLYTGVLLGVMPAGERERHGCLHLDL